MLTNIFCKFLFNCAISTLYVCALLKMISCCQYHDNSQSLTYVNETIWQKLWPLFHWRFASQVNLETHTFPRAIATVGESWLLIEIYLYRLVNLSSINIMSLLPFDLSRGPVMYKTTYQKGWVCENLTNRKHLLSFRVIRIVLKPNQFSQPYQIAHNDH